MRRRPSPNRITRFNVAAFAFLLGIFWLAQSWTCADPTHNHGKDEETSKVPLEVHIMSKCPDARDCLEQLVVPTMANVSDKVDFKLSFIGTTTDDDDGVKCMHGQTECLGNILELCAASEYPDPKIYLGFTMCLSRQYERIPKKDLIEDCALEHGIDFDTLNHCMSRDDGAYGMDMLRKSVQRSAKLGVSTSCTIRLNGKTRCVVDGGEFRDCDDGSEPKDLIRDIKDLYDEARGWSD
ncbi:hypothetical protein BU24DRAFT_431605 [Aaosphaeria arxii CBS 175.79]|uniref:GILT-domain-containing protein n=1 Tax=Aaosphaeria arxii CBS 175.79 TaxID=1450172 RepID=A0A6A5Y443_9PLEO|nr:uncharacterized protein BU24DRAFT_431605 [Aaosphaeria arxii CBS 175.79]KAF2020026.1 hypothetical protein BU24DRAFT_431605 [Aaosphaeria arxii CBS 175.79]